MTPTSSNLNKAVVVQKASPIASTAQIVSAQKDAPSGTACASASVEAQIQIDVLTLELRTKDEYLEDANEQLETSNQELKSANEELQSVNEELATVNTELQIKVGDLERTARTVS